MRKWEDRSVNDVRPNQNGLGWVGLGLVNAGFRSCGFWFNQPTDLRIKLWAVPLPSLFSSTAQE